MSFPVERSSHSYQYGITPTGAGSTSWLHAGGAGLIILFLLMASCAPKQPPSNPWLAAGCYTNTVPNAAGLEQVFDFQFSGVANRLDNAKIWIRKMPIPSSDGSCSGTMSFGMTVVRAPDVGSAKKMCGQLDPFRLGFLPTTARQAIDFGYQFPSDAWICDQGRTPGGPV